MGYQFDLESWESLGKVEQLSTRFTFTLHLHHSLPAERGNEEVEYSFSAFVLEFDFIITDEHEITTQAIE